MYDRLLLPHSIYKQLGLGALTPTRMTLELANRSITHPMGIAEDVVVRVDGFTFLADFVVVNFVPDPRVPIILGRPFLRTAKALIDLYEETLTLRVGKEELVYYADKSEKNKDKHFVHAISVIDFSKNDPFSGSTTTHSDDPSPSSSTVKTSDNLEKFTDELTPLNSLPPGDDVSIFKKDSQEGNFQVHSNPLFEFDDNFKSSTINPLFDEMEEDVEIENSNEPELLQTPLSNKGECFDPGDDIDEIDAFLAIEISMDYEEGYYDSGGDVLFLESLLCEDTTHNFSSEVISDHDTSISFSPRSDPLHHEFAGEAITLPSRNDREFEEYLSLMTVLCEISTSRSQEDVHANQSSIIESLPVSPIPVEDSDPVQEEIDIFLVPDDLIPPGVENDDSEDEDIELPNNDHQDDPSIPRPPPEPPDVEKCLESEVGEDDEVMVVVVVELVAVTRGWWWCVVDGGDVGGDDVVGGGSGVGWWWGRRLVSRAKVIENQVMAAPIIPISSDSSEESVPIISADPIVAPGVGAVPVVLPTRSFPLHLFLPYPEAILVRPGEAIPFGRLYRTHLNGKRKLLTARKRVRPIPARRLAWRRVSHHSSDRHSSPNSSSSSSPSDHSLFGHTPPMLIHLHHRDLFINHLLGLHDVVRLLDVRGLHHCLPLTHRLHQSHP
ncbi:reverse transcriptase domain-containing protein [Tanacetum coccineum]